MIHHSLYTYIHVYVFFYFYFISLPIFIFDIPFRLHILYKHSSCLSSLFWKGNSLQEIFLLLLLQNKHFVSVCKCSITVMANRCDEAQLLSPQKFFANTMNSLPCAVSVVTYQQGVPWHKKD